MTELSKLFPEIKDIDTSKLVICYIAKDKSLGPHPDPGQKYTSDDIPIFWAKYEEKLLYAICNSHRLGWFEDYYDWLNQDGSFFNFLEPAEKELSKILEYNPQYFIVNPDVFLNKDVRDGICQWEMDIITEWNRDRKINQILDDTNGSQQ